MTSKSFNNAVTDGNEGIGECVSHGGDDVVKSDDVEFPLCVGGGSHGEIPVSALVFGYCNCVEACRAGNGGQECTAA